MNEINTDLNITAQAIVCFISQYMYIMKLQAIFQELA